MITIRSIEETLRFYGSFGASQKDMGNGLCFTFPDQRSYVRFWGDLHGFCVASVDFTPPEDVVFRSQIQQRYLGIGFHEEGRYLSYMKKADARAPAGGEPLLCLQLSGAAFYEADRRAASAVPWDVFFGILLSGKRGAAL